MNDLVLMIEGDAKIKVTLFSGSGKLKMKVLGLSMNLVMSTYLDSNKRMQVILDDISVTTGDISISIDGGIGASVLNQFIPLIKSSIKK